MSESSTTDGPPSGAEPAAKPARPPDPSDRTDPSSRSDPSSSSGSTGPTEDSPPDPNAPPRRRRRGSRGGRNRSRGRSGSQSQDRASRGDAAEASGRRPGSRQEDYTDPSADRGLTTEDLADHAREEAGLAQSSEADNARAAVRPSQPQSDRPRIGDSRPAPVVEDADGADGADGAEPAATDSRQRADGSSPTRSGRRRRRGRGGRGGKGGQGGGEGRGQGRGESRGDASGGRPGDGRGRGRGRGDGSQGGGASRRSRQSKTIEADLGLGDGVDLDDIDAQVLERRRGQTRKGRPAGRYLMCVHVETGAATQIAVLEGRALVEHSVSRPEDEMTSIDGNIYLGRVQNVLPGMEAAFVDFGTPKNGVIYRSDVVFDESEVDEQQPAIERLLKNGQTIMTQVTKNPIGHKGARLTQEVSLAGRFVVMVPGQANTYGISKRLPDDERKRLRRVLDGIKPDDAGLIVRTAAEGATADELTRDLERLRTQWEQISKLASRSKTATLLYQEPPLVVRRIREEFTKEYRGVVIDDRALYEEIRGYVEAIAPELAERIEYYDEDEENLPLFERHHIHEQLVKAVDRKVWLPSGGSLIIERTEALTVIDVNTGKNVGKSNLEETVFKNNVEAAEEVAHQLRLRDIGGIIVIDFIDMEIKKNRDEVLVAFKAALARDKTRTQVFEISELGLVEMTRKRISEGLVEAFSVTCDDCRGRGFLVDESLLG